jgi:hypothetical protein
MMASHFLKTNSRCILRFSFFKEAANLTRIALILRNKFSKKASGQSGMIPPNYMQFIESATGDYSPFNYQFRVVEDHEGKSCLIPRRRWNRGGLPNFNSYGFEVAGFEKEV